MKRLEQRRLEQRMLHLGTTEAPQQRRQTFAESSEEKRKINLLIMPAPRRKFSIKLERDIDDRFHHLCGWIHPLLAQSEGCKGKDTTISMSQCPLRDLQLSDDGYFATPFARGLGDCNY